MVERLSPDGGWIASGTEEGDVHVQSIVIGAERWRVPKAHEGAVRVIAWSPGGTALASGGEDAIVKVWEATTGAILALYTEHAGPICALDWSPDGCWMTSAGGPGDLHVWQIHRENAVSTQRRIAPEIRVFSKVHGIGSVACDKRYEKGDSEV